jgi:predicted nucleic acid-binding protein
MRYTLDTNILLFYVRDSDTRKFIEENYAPFDEVNESIISIVTVGEIMVLASASRSKFSTVITYHRGTVLPS